MFVTTHRNVHIPLDHFSTTNNAFGKKKKIAQTGQTGFYNPKRQQMGQLLTHANGQGWDRRAETSPPQVEKSEIGVSGCGSLPKGTSTPEILLLGFTFKLKMASEKNTILSETGQLNLNVYKLKACVCAHTHTHIHFTLFKEHSSHNTRAKSLPCLLPETYLLQESSAASHA